MITMEYRFEAEDIPRECSLALEDLEHVTGIALGETEIPLKAEGKWLDSCFDRIILPSGCIHEASMFCGLRMLIIKPAESKRCTFWETLA